ncbi:MAG: hypothetical protein Q4D96_02205 [Propionibacteriaceae bacterium]|nr:hypothetical protein [Propionibacteriaceae bacterium]
MPRIAVRLLTCLAAVTIAVGVPACADGKPRQEELRETLNSRMLREGMSEEEKKATEGVIDCFVTELHGGMSADGLKALITAAKDPLAAGNAEDTLSEADLKVLAEAGAKCTAEEF